MKNSGLISLCLAMAMLGESNHKTIRIVDFDEEDITIRRKKLEERKLALLKKKGVQKFIINGETVYARDARNAIRKVNNIKSFVKL